jgi:Flp pilus assembly protein TadG
LFNKSRFCARFGRRLYAAAQCRRGVAAIEFGITMAIIVVVVLGTYDIGNYVLQQMKLADAAHVGGQYAISYPIDTAGAISAVDSVLPPAWVDDTTVTGPSMTCTCGSSGTGDAPTCSANRTARALRHRHARARLHAAIGHWPDTNHRQLCRPYPIASGRTGAGSAGPA